MEGIFIIISILDFWNRKKLKTNSPDEFLSRNKTPEKNDKKAHSLSRNNEEINNIIDLNNVSKERTNENNFELPDLNIYSKPINDQEQKFINLEHWRVLNEDLKLIQNYESNNSILRYSMTHSLSKINRDRRNQTVKKAIVKETGTSTDEYVEFSSLLKDPMKIDLIINALTNLKNDIIMNSVSKVK